MIPDILRNVSRIASNNSPLILTSFGVAGVVGTAVLTGRSTLYADRLIQDELNGRWEGREQGHDIVAELSSKEKVNLVWKEYIPPVLLGTVTIGAIVMSNRIGGHRAAAMATAFAITERSFGEYREKAVQMIGEKQERQIHDATVQDQVTKTPVPSNMIVMTSGKQLCFDSWSGRYWQSTMEDLKKGMNDLNHKLLTAYDNTASLTDFYNLIGLDPIQGSDDIGWNVDKMLDIEFTSCLSPDQEPAIAIKYRVEPTRGYFRR